MNPDALHIPEDKKSLLTRLCEALKSENPKKIQAAFAPLKITKILDRHSLSVLEDYPQLNLKYNEAVLQKLDSLSQWLMWETPLRYVFGAIAAVVHYISVGRIGREWRDRDLNIELREIASYEIENYSNVSSPLTDAVVKGDAEPVRDLTKNNPPSQAPAPATPPEGPPSPSN